MSMTAIIGAPHSVALDITNKCNLRCLHCFNNSGENDVLANELSDSEVLELVDSICQMHPLASASAEARPFCARILSSNLCGGSAHLASNATSCQTDCSQAQLLGMSSNIPV